MKQHLHDDFDITKLRYDKIIIMPAFAADTAAPSVTAKSAIAYCEDTNTNLYEKSINTRRDPLSTTKLLTAYIVMTTGTKTPAILSAILAIGALLALASSTSLII